MPNSTSLSPTPLLVGAVMLVLTAAASEPGSAQGRRTIDIQGSFTPLEGAVFTYAALLPPPPARADQLGMVPRIPAEHGGFMGVRLERPPTIRWDFGDGTAPVEVEAHTSVAHVWPDEGDYTLSVAALAGNEVVAETTRAVTVRNRRPMDARLAAVELDPDTRTVEFTASAVDVDGDTLTYRWSFGDGAGEEGVDLWRVRHRYPRPGEYTAIVRVDDGDGGEAADTVEIAVTGTAAETPPERLDPSGDGAVEPMMPGFRGELSGGVSGAFGGDMRSFAGLILNPVSDGVCRLTFTSWDDRLLGYVMGIIDLRGIPQGGGRYLIDGSWLRLVLEDDADDYAMERDDSALGMANRRGLGGLLGALTGGVLDDLPEADRARIIDTLGVDPRRPERNQAPPTLPSRSPLGIEERQGFESASGTLELTVVPGDGITGTYEVTLRNTAPEPPPGLGSIRMQGTFALDLRTARREGMVNYGGCTADDLEIVSHFPDDGEEHFWEYRPPVRISFDRHVDPATLDGERLQITFPAAGSGELVAVPARILRDRRRAWLVPEAELESGARYTVRVRTGAEGVRGLDGSELADRDGSGWWSFDFETMVDLIPSAENPQALLACDLYQTIRSPRLIRGKPALARVTARWNPPAGIHPSAHVTDFEARVAVTAGGEEQASTVHLFVRPDRWEPYGIDRRRAEHTAQVFGFTPDPAVEGYRVSLEVETRPGERGNRYWTRCATEHWDLAPVLTVDVFAVRTGQWLHEPDELQATLPVLERLRTEAIAYATQLYPVAEIDARPLQVLELGIVQEPDTTCGRNCRTGQIVPYLRAASDADIVVGVAPHDLRAAGDPARQTSWYGFTGGSTPEDAHLQDGQGVFVTLAGREPEFFSRYVFALVHEMGHTLELQHIPRVNDKERVAASAAREGPVPIQYQGIEGFRLSPRGDRGWNKSYLEGNEESTELAPLMYPGTLPTAQAFIANHHYRSIQELFERLGWRRNR